MILTVSSLWLQPWGGYSDPHGFLFLVTAVGNRWRRKWVEDMGNPQLIVVFNHKYLVTTTTTTITIILQYYYFIIIIIIIIISIISSGINSKSG